MEHNYLKSDLIKVIVLFSIFFICLLALLIWDHQANILGQIADKWL